MASVKQYLKELVEQSDFTDYEREEKFNKRNKNRKRNKNGKDKRNNDVIQKRQTIL